MSSAEEIAKEILEPKGQKRDWCSCTEGDMFDSYTETLSGTMKVIAQDLESYAEERVKEAEALAWVQGHLQGEADAFNKFVLRGGAMQSQLKDNFESNCVRIRNEALEEAAKVAESCFAKHSINQPCHGHTIRDEIRALKSNL